MSERKPREFEIEACPGCGCDPEACVCDECDEIETVPVVEVLGPERMLAWAIDRKGEEWCAHAVAQALCHAKHGDRRYDPGKRSHRRKWLRKGRVAVRALWGSGDGE